MNLFMANPAVMSDPAHSDTLVKVVMENISTISLGYVIMLASAIVLLVFYCRPSGPDNKYGPDPYGENAIEIPTEGL